ncbi:MAG: GGDEF domain-containing protein [Vallitaleaceae bacterium]|nr:GGDEF domain-containing protein [Vallitaleaceae bacterium]
MGKKHKGQIGQIEKDLRFQLFNGYLLLIVVFGAVYMLAHLINKRPLINIVTTFVILAGSFLLYMSSKFWGEYNKVRILFMTSIVLFFLPFGYWTSPGSDSAVIYTIILVINMISFIAVKKWEYLFALIACLETIVLLQSELWFPNHYMEYSRMEERISDLSFIFVVVSTAIILTIYFVMKSYSKHSESFYVESITDSLTGLYNRRYITEFIQNEYNRASRHGEHFSVALLDLNNFKKINDQRGHHEGDKVLAEISSIIKDNIRNYDVPGRYGGDEFIIIFPDTKKEKALELFSRLEAAFEKYGRKYKELEFAVSYGIEDSMGKSLDEIYKITDQLMYQKKTEQKGLL